MNDNLLLQFKDHMSQLSINELLEERKKISAQIITTFTLQTNLEELATKGAILDDLIEQKRGQVANG